MKRFALLALIVCAVPANAKTPLQPVDVKTVQSADYTAGETVRITGTAGELNVETWDQPRVEVTLTRSDYADAKDRDELKKKLERITVTVEKKDGAIDIQLNVPKRRFWARWLYGKTDATLTCLVRAPRDAKLVVRHQNGSVLVYGSNADIDASAHFGDIVLQLADPGQYAIDAKVRTGSVYSDYPGNSHGRVTLGENYRSEAGEGAHKVRLRVAIGGISIVKMGTPAVSGF